MVVAAERLHVVVALLLDEKRERQVEIFILVPLQKCKVGLLGLLFAEAVDVLVQREADHVDMVFKFEVVSFHQTREQLKVL